MAIYTTTVKAHWRESPVQRDCTQCKASGVRTWQTGTNHGEAAPWNGGKKLGCVIDARAHYLTPQNKCEILEIMLVKNQELGRVTT